MPDAIEKPKAGEPTNQLWRIVERLVEELTPLLDLTVVPDGAGKFERSKSNVKLVLKGILQIPDPPSSGDYVLTSQDGVIDWEEVGDDCA